MDTRNIKLTIEYDGTNYCGWQIQPQQMSIQKVLEKTLQQILNHPVKLIVAGRTDAGVHALNQIANFKTHSRIPTQNLIRAMNTLLPNDIAVKDAVEVPHSFNARRDAKWRIYQYRILNRQIPDVFNHNFVYHYPYKINIHRMRQAAKYFIGTHDFTAFNASPSIMKHSFRTIKKLTIKREHDWIYITIQGNAFVHNMVRIMVGTLLQVGRGKLEPEDVRAIIQSKQRKRAGMTVPAQGLFLMKVIY
ncbi:MAG: tRNA pseudouridine(38-40) synthase TruA [bacterium]|nr:tRNA pseudouridine(38-40) synthase TruA [bacterium]